MPRLFVSPLLERGPDEALKAAPAALAMARREGAPVLVTSLARGSGLVCGARQTSTKTSGEPVWWRSTTGTAARLEGRALYHAMAAPRLAELAPDTTPKTFLNRNVRGFLRGYSRAGTAASYLGRETILFGKRPAGVIGYDVFEDGAFSLELIVGWDVAAAFDAERPATSFVEAAAPACSEEQAVAHVHEGLARSWSCDVVPIDLDFDSVDPPVRPAPIDEGADVVTRPVPIGTVVAAAMADRVGHARVWLRGDALASNHALDSVEGDAARRLSEGRSPDEDLVGPLLGSPMDGARPADFLAAVERALALARRR